MKYFLLINLLALNIYAQSLDNNETKSEPKIITVEDTNTTQTLAEDSALSDEKLIVVKDNSGLSDDEVRAVAKQVDKDKKEKVSISDVVDAVNAKGNVDMSQLQHKWEDLSPTPVKYDWIQTKSGEWFKGEIKAMYDDKLEFDSDEVGLYSFDFEDIRQIKSYNIISINIENLATFPGIIRMKDEKIVIIQGENEYEFDIKDVVSLAPEGERELHYWSGKMTLSLDVRAGNVEQYDYSAKLNVKRRTASSRIYIDYLGRISSRNHTQTAEDHRANGKYDRYVTRRFFWTPIFGERYTDEYKNIHVQYTVGMGIGYTFTDTKELEWSISAGPALISTEYVSIASGKDPRQSSPAFEMSTKLEYELNWMTDINFDYKMTLTDKFSGQYKHHMVVTFENELLDWLDFDVTGVWDYVAYPEQDLHGVTPLKSDYQLLLGLGIEF